MNSSRFVFRSPRLPVVWLAATLVAAAAGFAQTAPAPVALAPEKEAPAVKLSPFEVNTSRDEGFVASSALAGGRLNTELKDTPVS